LVVATGSDEVENGGDDPPRHASRIICGRVHQRQRGGASLLHEVGVLAVVDQGLAVA